MAGALVEWDLRVRFLPPSQHLKWPILGHFWEGGLFSPKQADSRYIRIGMWVGDEKIVEDVK